MNQGGPTPLVTVLTPLYNHERYLDDYFRGLLSQTYRNLQVIVIDDGSTDGSWAKAKSYEAALRQAFPKVRLESHPNIGGTQEVLRGLEWVEGEYLSLLESDDYYLPTRIEEHVRFYRSHPDVGCVHSETDYMYGRRLERRHWEQVGRRIPSGDVFEALLIDNFVMMCALSVRTDLFRKHVDMRGYIAKGYFAHDYALCLDLSRHTSFGYIDHSLARYRVLQESYSHTRHPQRAFELERTYHQIKLDYIEKYGGSSRARDLAVEGLHHAEFLHAFRTRQRDRCEREYAWLLQHNPDRYGRGLLRAQAVSVRYPLAWKALKWLEDQPSARRAARIWRNKFSTP